MLNLTPDKRTFIEKVFLPENASIILGRHDAQVKEREAAGVTTDKRKEAIKRTYADQKFAGEFASARKIEITNDVLAHAWALAYFQITPLNNDEWPVIILRNRDKFYDVTFIGARPRGKGGFTIRYDKWL